MLVNDTHKILKLKFLIYDYWLLAEKSCRERNMNQVCSHLENINKIKKQIKNLQNNYSIDYIFSYN